ncbi:MAG: aldo/keto reductase [Propionibacteriaceae bacterium]|jgi:2,5-diketo-D-gluconate reductase A|nr:aldo/keto reductase [Propionibacteriaceae bacterium]
MTDPSDLTPRLTLNSGTTIPQLGCGVFKVAPEAAQQVVEQALELGYRHIDTATGYNNEAAVGAALKASGLPRDQIFVTTKLRNDHHRAGDVAGAFQRSLDYLGLDYVDLYLIHWPLPAVGRYVEVWRQLEGFWRDGRAKAIGVSNFTVPHLENLLSQSEVVPAVDQVELHPLFQQTELRTYLATKGIAVESWGPLGQGRWPLDQFPAIAQAAQAHAKSPAQVILRWHVQEGFIAIPKAVQPEHAAANLDLFDFELSAAELTAIRALDTGHRLGGDPDQVNG